MPYTVERYHDISAGHRVVDHESKCKYLHGHNYRIHFVCEADELDGLGRVIDFGVIKQKLCMWVEDNWDHRTLMWHEDPWIRNLPASMASSMCFVPFNPTAENMAQHLVEIVGPDQLKGTGVTLIKVRIEETRKCSATYQLGEFQL